MTSTPQGGSYLIEGVEFVWDLAAGELRRNGYATTALFRDSSLASLLAGFQAMVGTERFALAQQAEGRRGTGEDWQIITEAPSFEQGFERMASIAAVAGWGRWSLREVDHTNQRLVVRVDNGWEAQVQKSLGVVWGSNLIAGKFGDFATRLFGTNCWAEQTHFLAGGDAYDEFVAAPSARDIDEEIRRIAETEAATRTDLERALGERRRAQAELESSLALIRSQQRDIAKLSAPVLYVWDGILAVPLVGTLSSERAADVTERVLASVTEQEAHTVVLDVTGIENIDAHAVDALLKLAGGIKLLGGRTLLSGARAEMAQLAATGEVSLGDLLPFRTMQDAIKWCLQEAKI